MTTNNPAPSPGTLSWPTAPAGTRAAQLKFYENFAAKYYPGMWSKVRTPAKGETLPYPQYDGMTYGAIATSILNSEPGESPLQIAQGVAGQYFQDEIAGAVGQTVNAQDTALGATEKGLAQGLDWQSGILGFLADLTSANLWIRIAKIGIGGTILIVGLAKLTGTDQKLGSAVSTGVKYAPFL